MLTETRIYRDDIGTREIFTSRIEESVVHERAKPGSGKPIKQQPDRIVGLSLTPSIEGLLKKPYAEDTTGLGRSVKDVVKVAINRDNGGLPLLFPFLVLEAKSGEGNGFERVEVQSALPIMEALNLQRSLLTTPGNTANIPDDPLVWFFANRGEDWRVYAAYIVEQEELPHYVSIVSLKSQFWLMDSSTSFVSGEAARQIVINRCNCC
jgi:hypothetical protein